MTKRTRARDEPDDGAGRLEGAAATKFAHDLNNFLSIMIGYVDVLESEVIDDRHQADLRELRQAVEGAIALVRRRLPGQQQVDA